VWEPALHLPLDPNELGSATHPVAATAATPPLPANTFPAVRDGVDMAALVGAPQLFGRIKMLRNGFLVEPTANLILQPDGRITGHGHPNEGSWAAYEHGEVTADEAFAFISGGNGYIPSSTWTQSMGGIPIGHFCDEPEDVQANQRLCLIPHHPPRPADDVVYLVASCLRFYERTMPALLEQLLAEGIPKDRIKVVVNGCDRNEDRCIDGIDHAFSTHDGWEYSALYEAPLRWRFGYAFLMHDTNVIFPGFRRSVESFNRHLHWDHLPASPLARCLLGLYSHDFLTRLNGWLKTTHKISKTNGIIAEASAELLLRARSALVMGDAESNGHFRQAEWRELVDHFNTGQVRVRRAFPAIKLHKFIHAGPAKPEAL
jgi:hypothetical protein